MHDLHVRITCSSPLSYCYFFFFNDTATTEIYTLSLHDALPIWKPDVAVVRDQPDRRKPGAHRRDRAVGRGIVDQYDLMRKRLGAALDGLEARDHLAHGVEADDDDGDRSGHLGAGWYSNQSPVEGIGGEPEALEGVHAQNRLRAGLREHSDRGLDSIADPHLDPRDRVSNLASVGEHEGPFLLGRNAETVQDVPGDPRVGGTGVHQGQHGHQPSAALGTHLHPDPEMAHFRIWRRNSEPR